MHATTFHFTTERCFFFKTKTRIAAVTLLPTSNEKKKKKNELFCLLIIFFEIEMMLRNFFCVATKTKKFFSEQNIF